jgi:hypothetical protein
MEMTDESEEADGESDPGMMASKIGAKPERQEAGL